MAGSRKTLFLLLWLLVCYFGAGVLGQRGGRPGHDDPETEPEPPIEPPETPGSSKPGTAGGLGDSAQVPFNGGSAQSGKDGDVDLQELAKQIADLLESLTDLLPASTSTSDGDGGAAATSTPASASASASAAASAAAATTTSGGDASMATAADSASGAAAITGASTIAALGCSVFQAYTTMCSQSVQPPSVFYNPLDDTTTTGTVDSVDASIFSVSASASCLCYSSTAFVPDVFDAAINACADFIGGNFNQRSHAGHPTLAGPDTSSLASVASAAHDAHPCSLVGNIRSAPSSTFAGFNTASPTQTAAASSTTTAGAVWLMDTERRVETTWLGVIAGLVLALVSFLW